MTGQKLSKDIPVILSSIMLIVYALSTAGMLWSLYRNNWEWKENNICCQAFQIQPNSVTKVLDFPLTIFIAASTGAAGGYLITFVIGLVYPAIITTILGVVIVQAGALKYIKNTTSTPSTHSEPRVASMASQVPLDAPNSSYDNIGND
jgi:hypothetical protein